MLIVSTLVLTDLPLLPQVPFQPTSVCETKQEMTCVTPSGNFENLPFTLVKAVGLVYNRLTLSAHVVLFSNSYLIVHV